MLKLSEVCPSVYELNTGFVNLFIINEDKLTLIDSGFKGNLDKVAESLTALGRSIREVSCVIVTHNHFDHIGTIAEIKEKSGCEVIIHHDDVIFKGFDVPYANLWRWFLTALGSAAYRDKFMLRADMVDTLLTGGERLPALGGLDVIHTPGHTRGSVCLYSLARKTVFVGDSLGIRGNNLIYAKRFPSIDYKEAVKSLLKLQNLAVEYICPGHGRSVKKKAASMLEELFHRA